MGINLNRFRQLTSDFGRGCHFNLGFPDWKDPGLGTDAGPEMGIRSLGLTSLFASSTTIPGRKIESTKIGYQHGMPKIAIATDVSYDSWTVTFYSDAGYLLRTYFLRWMDIIANSHLKSFNAPGFYKSDKVYAALLNGTNSAVHVVGFKGMFPVEVGSITVNQQDSGITTFDVTFEYDFCVFNDFEDMRIANAVEKVHSENQADKNELRSALGKTVDGEIDREKILEGLVIKLPYKQNAEKIA